MFNFLRSFLLLCYFQEADSKELVAIDLGLVSPAEPPQNSGTPPGSTSSPPSHIFFSHSSTSRGTQHHSSVFYPSQSRSGSGSGSRAASTDPPRRVSAVPQVAPSAPAAENLFLFRDSQGLDSGWEARRQEALELEHQQTMSLLLLQQCVWEEKRRAARQKEKAARAKKRYYQAKLHKLGVEAQPSSSDSDEGGEHPKHDHWFSSSVFCRVVSVYLCFLIDVFFLSWYENRFYF